MRKAELNEVQNLIYGILIEFDRICGKYGIQYSLEGGSLLGAVKYGDYVPWDDDIDVIMLRSEYDRFLQIAPEELGDEYFLQSYHNVPDFPLNYAKLCYTKSKICDYSYSHLQGMSHGIFMDIFPIDNVIPNRMKNQIHAIGLLTGARRAKLHIPGSVSRWKKLCYGVMALFPMRTLCYWMDSVCTVHNQSDTGFCYEVCNSNKNFKPLPSTIYKNCIRLRFRDREFLAVSCYDQFLKSRFGENYLHELPPEDKRKPSHCQNILIEG